jgi:radical SAM protein with 4Fe4S-binding SPASM domain
MASYSHPEKKMRFSTFSACLDKIPSDVRVHFSGFSEPFLNDECTDMIVYAAERGHWIVIYTTLVGFTASDAARLNNTVFKMIVHVPDAHTRYNKTEFYEKLDLLTEYNIPYTAETVTNIIDRAGNLSSGPALDRISGKIKCTDNRHLQNVLLPNGDVVLCCMDYSLKYRLGNLIEQEYEDLFNSSNFRRVIHGMKDDSIDIMCRKCNRAYND